MGFAHLNQTDYQDSVDPYSFPSVAHQVRDKGWGHLLIFADLHHLVRRIQQILLSHWTSVEMEHFSISYIQLLFVDFYEGSKKTNIGLLIKGELLEWQWKKKTIMAEPGRNISAI